MAMTIERPPSALADIELAPSPDTEVAASLWERCGGRTSPGTAAPEMQIVALERLTGRVVGAAEFVRTFPPEDALASLCVDPAFRRMGIGRMLLEALMTSAARQGRRNLCAFVPETNLAAWKLLEASGAPAHAYQSDGGYYVELETTSRRELP